MVLIQAAFLRERGVASLAIGSVVLDGPRAHEIFVDVTASELCQTDLLPMRNDSHHVLPMVLGHEGTGTVSAVGGGVKHVRVGDRVEAIDAMMTGDVIKPVFAM